ncbi:2-phosphosulfolactate phosphatase [Bacillus sp. ISL-45]|uniref:2-phosphosulfolactate phosphatase n=1 Tax=Bacillus sp. ISL-45 TaxID=2819128 RepID=UPI001BE7C93C|nr:2-phosphosulfolactate phosphatase [Bacillus sp. ISL-45]MBT2659548.1 2-phosphosulfolactate phosphatase [Bacillus sp. ISL-45]
MRVNIYQGHQHNLPFSDANIVIDVIRAFTVAHHAFLGGAKEILLVNSVSEAVALKEKYPNYFLAGEIKGLPIAGFDLDNSPRRISGEDVRGRTIVQKTTNGVRALLNALNAEKVYATGFSNARKTAGHILKTCRQDALINIIASHPDGDDDLACAEYIKSIIEDDATLAAEDVVQRIVSCEAARKFFDHGQPDFDARDLDYCTKELDEAFVMVVDDKKGLPRIVRLYDDETFWFKAPGAAGKAKDQGIDNLNRQRSSL